MWKKRINKEQLLDAIPLFRTEVVKNELDDGGFLLTFKPQHNFWYKLVNFFVPLPKTCSIWIDKLGHKVINSIDGKRTIRQIVHLQAETLPFDKHQIELATLQFLAALGERGVIVMKPNSQRLKDSND